MPHLDELHDDARQRFDELGRDLLASLTTFREPQPQPSESFEPDIFKTRAITDRDVVGDVHVGWQNRDGEPIGIAVADIGGTRTGFIGQGFTKLQGLARAMAKASPFASTASVEFLQTQVFEWVKERHRAHSPVGCVDFVLSALKTAAAEHRVVVPVSDLYVESPLAFGPVTIVTFPDAFFQQFEAWRLPESEPPGEHQAWCRSMRSDFQGLAAAESSAFGEPIRARQLAIERIELVVGILRFFAPAHRNAKVVSRIARWGYAPQRTETIFVAEPTGRCSTIKSSLIDQPGRAVIDDQMKSFLLGAGLAEVREIVAREKRSELEQALLTGMVTFGRAALTPDLRERMVWYCAGLESILLRGISEGIGQNLGERLAMFSYDTVDERSAALADVRKAYSLRSSFVHHGIDIEDREIVDRFARHGLRLFIRIAKSTQCFSTQKQFIDHIDRMKLSGGQRSI